MIERNLKMFKRNQTTLAVLEEGVTVRSKKVAEEKEDLHCSDRTISLSLSWERNVRKIDQHRPHSKQGGVAHLGLI